MVCECEISSEIFPVGDYRYPHKPNKKNNEKKKKDSKYPQR